MKFFFSFNNSWGRILTNIPPRNTGLGLDNKTENKVGCPVEHLRQRFHPFQILVSPIGPGADQEAEKDDLSAFGSHVCLYSVPGDSCRAPSVDQK